MQKTRKPRRSASRAEKIGAFGARVRELREQRGMTQETLAGLSDMSRAFLSQVETGAQNVSVEKVVNLANALRVAPSELFTGYTLAAMKKLYR